MKKLVLLALLVLLGLSNIRPASVSTIWDDVCSMMRLEYSCVDMPMPKRELVEMEDSEHGEYDGGDVLKISDSMSWAEQRATTFHEMVHYLQVQSGEYVIPGYPKDICEAEAEAYVVSDVYRIVLGLEPVGQDWWKPYYWCWEFYGSEGGMGIWFDKDGSVTLTY